MLTHLKLYIWVRTVFQSSHFGSRYIYSNKAVSIHNAFGISLLKFSFELVFKSLYFQTIHFWDQNCISSLIIFHVNLICLLPLSQDNSFFKVLSISIRSTFGSKWKSKMSLKNIFNDIWPLSIFLRWFIWEVWYDRFSCISSHILF